jgi:hypothetical protein
MLMWNTVRWCRSFLKSEWAWMDAKDSMDT